MTAPNVEHDYSGFAAAAPAVTLSDVQAQGAALLESIEQVDDLKAKLARAEANVKRISEEVLPELLVDAKLEGVDMAGGVRIALDKLVGGSILKGQEEAAHIYLEATGHGALVKRQFTIKFGKGDDKWADKFERDCGQRKRPLALDRKKAVHPQTLGKFIRDQMEAGEELPEAFSTFERTVARVHFPEK